MGIVRKQSINNTIITVIGFGIGALNTLYLYTNFLTDEYYGLVSVILATAALLMPLLSFGVHNTLVKFYSSFTSKKETDSFLNLMLFLPFALIVPIAIFSYVAIDFIADFLSSENELVKDYVWHIFLIGIAMAYFEVFYAWARVQLKSVFGNFMKEIFGRLCIAVLLILVSFKTITVDQFLIALVVVYILRMAIMKGYAYYLKPPSLIFKLPKNTKAIIKYAALIILGGSAAVVLLEIDKFMLNQYVDIEKVAYYSVAIFIATIIAVPARSMHQITYPLTAKLLNANDKPELEKLYKKSSLTLLILAGILFLLIVLNLQDLYNLVPETFRGGAFVVFLIGLVKVYDALLGNNNSILYNSNYYRAILIFGVFLAAITILLNYLFIPKFGMDGAACATLIAFAVYNTIKLLYVKKKFNMLPFTSGSAKVLFLLLLIGGIFYFINFNFHPIVNIALKSVLMIAVYGFVIYRFKISEDVNEVIAKYLKRH